MQKDSLDKDNMHRDPGLYGNDAIESAIEELTENPSPEVLAKTLTVIRRRMKENGQVVAAVTAPDGSSGVMPRILASEDGKRWWTAFTSFDEQMMNQSELMSTFLVDMNQLFRALLTADGINGIVLNPWNRTIWLDRRLIEIILGINT